MRDHFGLIFVVLMASGVLCILASLGVLGCLYNSHAVAIADDIEYFASFMVFVLAPAVITIVAGIWLLVTGVRIGQRTSGEPPEKKQE